MDYFVVVFLSLLSYVSAQSAEFVSPQFEDTSIGGRYGSNSLWPLGSTQIVAFSCPWESYRLELWQQHLSTQSAVLSTNFVYNQSAGEHLAQSFHWTVQTYELQLADSPVFFWWLYDNTDSTTQQTSAYFNITLGSASDSTSSSSTPTPTVSSTLSTSSTTQTTSSTSTSAPSSSSNPIQPAIDSPSATAVSGQLSTGAAVGIGVGAAFGGILILAAGALLFLKRRKRREPLRRQLELQGSEPMKHTANPYENIIPASKYVPHPVEAPPHYYSQPAELG
ncbi:hypothetical protein GGR51DRAFT_565729 [Nemania sp. FL0031]|nr:hypothetical protein GGR51DRAFT_565729 [Nemania sp. FL0031]